MRRRAFNVPAVEAAEAAETAPKVNCRTSDQAALVIDDHAQALALIEERQTVPPRVLSGPSLVKACDLAAPDQDRHMRCHDAEALGHNGCIDLDGVSMKVDTGATLL